MSQENKAPCDSPRSNSKKKRYNLSELVSSSSLWQILPDLIFSDIMMMMGLKSIKDLQKCREVCQRWNLMVTQMTQLKRGSIRREAESVAGQMRRELQRGTPRLPEFLTTAGLAHHGMLGSVEYMDLNFVDLASVPAEHLASLVSCVTRIIYIINVTNCDLVNILASVKCQLYINRQTLSSKETWALVRAMETRVESVTLHIEVS